MKFIGCRTTVRGGFLTVSAVLLIFSGCTKNDSKDVNLSVTTAPITEITHTRAVSGGDVLSDGGEPLVERGVCYDTLEHPTIISPHTSDGNVSGEFVSVMASLQAGRRYYVRAFVRNSTGIAYGDELSFTTQQLSVSCISGRDSVSDVDGHYYQVVSIGGLCWMSENLQTLHFRNGDTLQVNLEDSVWSTTTTPACDVYGNNTLALEIYGRLYNWYAVADPRGLCPVGWHVASDGDWNSLVEAVDQLADTTISGSQSAVAGGDLKELGLAHWSIPNDGATNESGFTALPGGYRNNFGAFNLLGSYGYWWTATQSATNNAWYRTLNYNNTAVYRDYELMRSQRLHII